MKKIILFILPLFFFACEEDSQDVVMIDTSMPTGELSVMRSGTFVDQNSSGTMGMASLGTDEDGTQFLRFSPDFETKLTTGTVTVFLSTSDTYVADPGNGNPDLRLLGSIAMSGESFFRIAPVAESRFTHVIVWCASAAIPFGYAPLQ